jgi:hypothetical protein
MCYVTEAVINNENNIFIANLESYIINGYLVTKRVL